MPSRTIVTNSFACAPASLLVTGATQDIFSRGLAAGSVSLAGAGAHARLYLALGLTSPSSSFAASPPTITAAPVPGTALAHPARRTTLSALRALPQRRELEWRAGEKSIHHPCSPLAAAVQQAGRRRPEPAGCSLSLLSPLPLFFHLFSDLQVLTYGCVSTRRPIAPSLARSRGPSAGSPARLYQLRRLQA